MIICLCHGIFNIKGNIQKWKKGQLTHTGYKKTFSIKISQAKLLSSLRFTSKKKKKRRASINTLDEKKELQNE